MHAEIKIHDQLYYVGGSDRRISLFENVYPVPEGVSYNSYLYLDEKTLLMDTVDASVADHYFDTLEHILAGRPLDYIVINHMEPDHAASVGELLLRHPEVTVVTNAVAWRFFGNFFPHLQPKKLVVKEGDRLSIGRHEFTFVTAQMVHWPEVMFTYETTEKTLFSADAFGTFGALNGDIFASPCNFDLAECRRYYANIVGKYGPQVLAALKKASCLDVEMICPLHGPIHREGIKELCEVYQKWASYTPEQEDAVVILYASVYGGTANAMDVLAAKVVERGARNIRVYDVSKVTADYLVAEAWRAKTLVLAGTTYNSGVFVKMEEFLHELVNHQLRNRTIALVENGTWAPMAKASMKKILENLKDLRYLEKEITILSRIKDEQEGDLDALADQIAASAKGGI